jgi:multidrug efflux pump subunit AcrA (membrane-fusion protein)
MDSVHRRDSAADSLFRRQAVHASARAGLGAISIVAPPGASLVCGLSVLLFLLLLHAATLIEIPDRTRAVGFLEPGKRMARVHAPRTGWVSHLSAADGQRVAEGAPLLRIEDRDSAPGEPPMAARRSASLRRQIALLEAARAQELRQIETQLDAGEATRRSVIARIADAEERAILQSHQVTLLQRRVDRVRQLAGDAALSQQQLDETELDLLRARVGEAAVAGEIHALRSELQIAEQGLASLDARRGESVIRAEMQKEALLRDLGAAEMSSALQLRAQAAGEIAALAVRNGSFVRSGQLLLTIFEPESSLQARLFVPAAAAGHIARGQRVELVLDAFPSQIYGLQSARVDSVSKVAMSAEELGLEIALSGAVFEIRASAPPGERDAIAWQLPPGTPVKADLIRSRRSLLHWFLKGRHG